MKLTFFSHSSTLCGAGRSLCDLVKGFTSRGVVCSAILPKNGVLADCLRELGCSVYCVNSEIERVWQWVTPWQPKDFYFAYDLFASSVIPEVKKISPDFVITQTITLPWGAFCAEILGIPHVLSAREYGGLDHNLNFNFGYEASIQALYETSSRALCITNDVKRVLFGSDEEKKCEVIYSGIELDESQLRSSYNYSIQDCFSEKSGPVIALIGTVQKGKGQSDLIRAITDILRTGQRVRCLMIGMVADIEYKKELLRLIADSGYGSYFAMAEFDADIYPLMQQVDVVVSCSRREALGRVLIEAALLSKPIIYSNTGGPLEVFENGVHGLAYEPGNIHDLSIAIQNTLSDQSSTRVRLANALSLCQKIFNNQAYTNKTISALENSINPCGDSFAVSKLVADNLVFYKSQYLAKPQIYLSTCDGYSEHHKMFLEPMPWGAFEIDVEFQPPGLYRLRLDPVEGMFCEINELKIKAFEPEGSLLAVAGVSIHHNGQQMDCKILFANSDPQIEVFFHKPVIRVVISGDIRKSSPRER